MSQRFVSVNDRKVTKGTGLAAVNGSIQHCEVLPGMKRGGFRPESFFGLIQHEIWFGLPKNIGKPVKEELFRLGFCPHHPEKCNDASP
jgi:hypothetical protein